MKSIGLLVAIGLVLISAKSVYSNGESPVGVDALLLQEPSGPMDKFGWLENLEMANSIAAKHDRPLMVVFR